MKGLATGAGYSEEDVQAANLFYEYGTFVTHYLKQLRGSAAGRCWHLSEAGAPRSRLACGRLSTRLSNPRQRQKAG